MLTGPDDLPNRRTIALPYLPGLDGLRALAVIAVLLYHAGLPLPGGFFGVEIFFVLSGYLITSLLVAEWDAHGGISLKRFWMRRARRLLPALFLFLAGTLVIAAFLPPREMTELRGDVLAALGYVMNWRLVLSEQSYFVALARPPLLQHLWSLAIEEQFYLLWPLLFVGGMRLLRRRGLLVALALATIGSAVLMAVLYQPGADPSRIYYGTDTRASALLLGAALALVWRPGHLPEHRRAGIVATAVGGVGLITLGLACALIYDSHPMLYRGGFALVSIATALVIAAAVHPQARLLHLGLGWGPLRWIGVRSYGIYLWHWPIFLVTRPRIDVPLSGLPLFALRIALTVALAAFSYHFVERPLRHPPEPDATPEQRHPYRMARGRAAAAVGLIVVGLLLPRPSAPTRPTITRRTAVPAEETAAADGAATPSATPRATSSADEQRPAGGRNDGQIEPIDPALAAELEDILGQTVESGYVPGAVLAASLPGHETWVGAAGVMSWDTEEPMTPETPFFIGSVSKMWTAVLVMQLWQEGQINLDDPISTWLPDLHPDGEIITVRHLLSHTSGIYDYLEDPEMIDAAYADPSYQWAPEELVGYAAEFPLLYDPGSPYDWAYASTNYVILGMIIEHVTGNPLAAELQRRIIEPLGLQHTFVIPDEQPDVALPQGYIGDTGHPEAPLSFVFGTANIVSTAEDLQRFGRALFEGELLEQRTLDEMQQFVTTYGAYEMPELEYGLGLMRNHLPPVAHTPPEPNDPIVLGHIGGFAGFRSALWYDPKSGAIIALGVNQSEFDPNEVAAPAMDAVLESEGE